MNIISIYTSPKRIIYNDDFLTFNFELPDVFPSDFFCLYWWEHEQKFEYWTKGDDGQIQIHKLTDSDFEQYVSPFLEQFTNYTPSESEIRNEMCTMTQLIMDDTVCKLGYDNILTACSYANSTNATFAKEGQACVAWRDECWDKCFRIIEDIIAGNRSIPTEDELKTEFPELIIE